jgi:lipid-A-disaccharide synthase
MTAGPVPLPNPKPLRIVIVAGETSGDNLAARLIDSLRARLPRAQFAGIAGPRMIAAGCDAWEHAESLAVMGLIEIIPHLPRLFRIRRRLLERVSDDPPDIYIGVDAKEFNLRVAAKLKAQGIRTVQYVSPQVWAWRQGRVKTIGRAVDLILCLLPFEKQFYDKHAVHAEFVGHPLADEIPLHLDRFAARRELSIAEHGEYVSLLPGSRRGEVTRLATDFAATVRWLSTHKPALHFLAPMANDEARALFSAALEREGVADRVKVFDGQSQTVMAASDVVLLASGTATLEATLVKRPMVVAYRVSFITALLFKYLKLFKAPFFSQPNLLAGRRVVPEFLNDEVRPEVLGPAVLAQFGRVDLADLVHTFTSIHETLRRGASDRAADAIVALLNARSTSVEVES